MSCFLTGHDAGPRAIETAILQRFGGWAASQIPHVELPQHWGPHAVVAIVPEPRLDVTPLAVVVYHGWVERWRVIEMSMAASTPRWATRRNIGYCLAYPFLQLDVERVQLIIPRRAKRARRFVAGIGFVLEGCARRGFGDDNAMLYSMLRPEAERWIGRATAKAAA